MLDAKIAAFRMRRHHLSGTSRADGVTICGDVCGVQAQLMQAACLQVWVRNRKIRRVEIEDALWKSRTLVRTTLMRQTLHLIPSADYPVYVAALRESLVGQALRMMARFRITATESDALNAMILETLASGPMTKVAITAALRPRVSSRVGSWMDRVWSILRIPVAEGLICYGPGTGNQVTFIRTDQWLKKQRTIAEADAKSILLRRYLRAYGPATPHDFAHWGGMAIRECARVFEQIKDELIEVPGHGAILAEDRKAFEGARIKSGVRLLPAFDPFLLAHREKDHLVEPRYYKRVYRNQGWISPVVLVDGRVAGTWSHKLEDERCLLQAELFPGTPRDIVAVEAEAGRIGAFLIR